MNDKLLNKVRALIAKAEGTEFVEEAQAFRAKADSLMEQYAIEQWQLDSLGSPSKPEARRINVEWWASKLGPYLMSLFTDVAKHCRVVAVLDNYDYHRKNLPVVGLPSDLDYFEMLFTSLHLQWVGKLSPVYNPELTLGENLLVFKEAGLSWRNIAMLIGRPEFVTADNKVVDGGFMVREYKKECKKQDVPPVRSNPAMYQRNFTMGWVSGVRTQLQNQREQSDTSKGNELVLSDINKAVKDAALEMFPTKTAIVRSQREANKQDYATQAAGRAAGESADIMSHHNKRFGVRKQINA